MPRTPRKIRLGDSAFQVEWNAMVDMLEYLKGAAETKKKEEASAERGITVYVKVCKADSTEVFIPIKVYGAIYATAAGDGYQELTPEAADVPDNSTVIQ
jgi:hypothetical protein